MSMTNAKRSKEFPVSAEISELISRIYEELPARENPAAGFLKTARSRDRDIETAAGEEGSAYVADLLEKLRQALNQQTDESPGEKLQSCPSSESGKVVSRH